MAQLTRISFLIIWLSVMFCTVKTTLNEDQVISLRNFFEQSFKFRAPTNHRVVKPPTHMVQLHRMYSNNGALENLLGNTVRSILPTIEGSEMIFNLSGIERAEEIKLVQLLLHTHRLRERGSPINRQSTLAAPTKVILYLILPNKGTEKGRSAPLVSRPVHTGIWHSLNITAELGKFLMEKQSSSFRLGMRFETAQHNVIAPEHFLRTDKKDSAALVIFSNNNLDSSAQHGDEKKTTDNKDGTQVSDMFHDEPPVTSRNEKYGNIRRNIRSIRNSNTDNNVEQNKRERINSHVHDNEVFDLPKPTKADVPQTSPRPPPVTQLPTWVAEPSNDGVPQVTPVSVEEGCAREISPENLTSTISGQIRTIVTPPTKRQSNSTEGRRSETRQPDTPCGLRNMYVDFADIGWDDWIVAPPGYDAHDCDGSCPSFKFREKSPQTLNFTNHEIVRSLVLFVYPPREVRKTCCVPNELTSLSILYLEQENNVVLKTYQDMVVKSCVCR